MKKRSTILIVLLIVILTACEIFSDDSQKQIKYVSVTAGGCNLGIPDSNLRSTDTERPDTIHFTFKEDTLTAFIGFNYICCAPFDINTEVVSDTFFIEIIDTCDLTFGSCYCRCNCYYTWDVKFANVPSGILNYKITLFDPRVGESATLKEGDLVIPLY